MNTQQKRVFRIEKYMNSGQASVNSTAELLSQPIVAPVAAPAKPKSSENKNSANNQDVINLLREIKSGIDILVERPAAQAVAPVPVEKPELKLSEEEIEEARKLRNELKEIYDAIERTKVEILTIHQSGVNGMEISRVSDELGAIVEGTEKATETILESAESIDQIAADLVAALTSENHQGMVGDMQDQVIQIFESCNFQDLTGQRISKVVSAFGFIEERVIQMMEIWGGVESFAEVEAMNREDRAGDKALLNGPALNEDENVASQDDIDALFD